MKIFLRNLFVLLAIFSATASYAQNIHGTWQGEFEAQRLVVSIEQKGMEICGFTHDFILNDSSDNCTAAYAGKYVANQKIWVLDGNRFIKNSGSHVLMHIVLWQDPRYGKNVLRGKIFTGSAFARMMGMGGTDILLRKSSVRPTKLPGGQPNCFPEPPPPPKPKTVPKPAPTPAKPVPEKPAPPVVVTPAPAPVKNKPILPDTVKKPAPAVPKPVFSRPDAEIVKDMARRKQKEQSRLEVSVKKIVLKLYDNGVVDNDTVSVFYNGKLLVSHQRLSETPIIINLDLEEGVTQHSITMYAENLGGIPPNTALVVVTAGDKRYELRSSASLEENAVLIFDYKPK
jgi:hypothetical protein